MGKEDIIYAVCTNINRSAGDAILVGVGMGLAIMGVFAAGVAVWALWQATSVKG